MSKLLWKREKGKSTKDVAAESNLQEVAYMKEKWRKMFGSFETSSLSR